VFGVSKGGQFRRVGRKTVGVVAGRLHPTVPQLTVNIVRKAGRGEKGGQSE
jgi:hypothetical protein